MTDAWTWRHAVANSELPSTTKHVLLTLSLYMNEVGGACYPTIETLCKQTSLSNRAVISHIQKAIEEGWLSKGTHGFSGQKWRRNEYAPSWPERLINGKSEPKNQAENTPEKVVNEGHDLSEGGEPDDNKVVNVVPKGGERGSHYTSREHSNEHSITKGRTPSASDPRLPDKNLSDGELFETGDGIYTADVHPDFETAWKLYNSSPLKANQIKKQASAAWFIAVGKVPARLILKAIADEVDRRVDYKSRKAEGRAARDEFVSALPAMHRWLRDERFNDVLDQLQSKNGDGDTTPEDLTQQRIRIFKQRNVWLPKWGEPPAEVRALMDMEQVR